MHTTLVGIIRARNSKFFACIGNLSDLLIYEYVFKNAGPQNKIKMDLAKCLYSDFKLYSGTDLSDGDILLIIISKFLDERKYLTAEYICNKYLSDISTTPITPTNSTNLTNLTNSTTSTTLIPPTDLTTKYRDPTGLIYSLGTNVRLTLAVLEKMSILLWYVNKKTLGLNISEFLLFYNILQNKSVINKDCILKNELYYNDGHLIQKISSHRIKIITPLVNDSGENRYLETNPSIINYKDEFLACVRTVNYTQKDAVDYTSMSIDNKIRTRNFLVMFDKSFNIKWQKEIVDVTDHKKLPHHVLGLEDLRLFTVAGKIYFLVNSREHYTNCLLLYVGEILINNNDTEVKVKLDIIRYGNEYITEKNWLPIMYDNIPDGKNVKMIYSYHPLTIIEADLNLTGKCDLISANKFLVTNSDWDFSRFRGSGGPIQFKYANQMGWLILVHEYIPRGIRNGRHIRKYYHRFVWLNKEYVPKTWSLAWSFFGDSIEYGVSLIPSPDGNVLISMGREDCEAWIFTIDPKVIEKMLR